MSTPEKLPMTDWEASRIPDVVAGLRGLIDLQSALNGRIETVLQALAAGGLTGTNGQEPIVPVPTLQLPLSPAILNSMIFAANLGVSIMGIDKVDVLVPAGGTVVVTVPSRTGYVTVTTGPLKMTSTLYSVGLGLAILVDGQLLTSADYPYTITNDDQVTFGQYFWYEKQVVGTFVNATALPATVSFSAEGVAVQRDFFKNFYVPLLRYSYDVLKRVAQAANGGVILP